MRREKKDQILAVLPEKIRGILLNHGLDFEKIQEIRLREEQPLAVKKEGKEELFTHRVTKEELRETMEYVSNYSLYAYENELRSKNGFTASTLVCCSIISDTHTR